MANTQGTTGLLGWIDERFPLTKSIREHLTEYYAPKNFNFWYFFGSLALLVLVNQILTGIWLTMSYKPSAADAFASVEYIMRDVDWGWLIRYMHSTGASAFFIVVYLHMFRALIYGSYKKPRELIWIFGVLIFLALMAEAFMGYLLPWGQMSYWGAQVIISLFSAIPGIGQDLSLWIRGDYVVSDATLNRFFSLHVIAVPLVLLGLVVAHILALHEVGSNNPDGVEIKKVKGEDGKPLTLIRCEGLPESVGYRSGRLKDMLAPLLPASAELAIESDPARNAGIWKQVRDVEPFAARKGGVWRLSVKPSDGPDVVSEIAGKLGCEALYDWGGGLVWLLADAADGEAAAVIRGAVDARGGHATLFRRNTPGNGSVETFHPEQPRIAAISQNLRRQFDPAGILNPGLMSRVSEQA